MSENACGECTEDDEVQEEECNTQSCESPVWITCVIVENVSKSVR